MVFSDSRPSIMCDSFNIKGTALQIHQFNTIIWLCLLMFVLIYWYAFGKVMCWYMCFRICAEFLGLKLSQTTL